MREERSEDEPNDVPLEREERSPRPEDEEPRPEVSDERSPVVPVDPRSERPDEEPLKDGRPVESEAVEPVLDPRPDRPDRSDEPELKDPKELRS